MQQTYSEAQTSATKNALVTPIKNIRISKHQHKPNDDRIYQIIKRGARATALVAGDHYIQIRRQYVALHFFNGFLYIIRSFNQIFAGAFNNIKCNYIFPLSRA